MTKITVSDTASSVYQLVYMCARGTGIASGRLRDVSDLNIPKRPTVLTCYFISSLGRVGRSERFQVVSCWEGKRTCFSPYIDRIGKRVLNVLTS
jgi:hypothetical protein